MKTAINANATKFELGIVATSASFVYPASGDINIATVTGKIGHVMAGCKIDNITHSLIETLPIDGSVNVLCDEKSK